MQLKICLELDLMIFQENMDEVPKFFKKNWLDLVFIAALILLAPLFFYKLGQSSLISWDEAWYAEIAKNIVNGGNLFQLKFNGQPYFDHPPAGFWLTAISFKVFGISNFSARFAQALLGFLSLYVIYFLGKELFSRSVGFASAIGLASSFWFLFRARSGNLDVSLTFFFLLTLLFAFKAAKERKYLIPLSLGFTLLTLSKTLVPFVILPALIVIFWKSKSLSGFRFKLSLIIFLIWFGSWLLIQILEREDFLKHYVNIGVPGVKVETSILDNLKLAKAYLHDGVGKWFWPGIAAIFLSLFLRRKQFLVLSTFFIIFFIPFIFSPKGHIWHLIPLHPILILSFFGFLFYCLEYFFRVSKLLKGKRKDTLIFTVLFFVSLFWATPQIKQMWQQFIDIPVFISDEEILGKEAGKYSQDFFLDDDSVPAVVFYSGKHVERVGTDKIAEIFENKKNFLLITKQWRLDDIKISKDQYEILKKDRDKILVRSILE